MREILRAAQLRSIVVEIAGEKLKVLEPSQAQRDQFAETKAKSGNAAGYAYIFEVCLRDENGAEIPKEDILSLATGSGRVVGPLEIGRASCRERV